MNSPLWKCDDLISACDGVLFDPSMACSPISGIEFDSRNCGRGDLFVALAGDKQDGHDFLAKAVNAGATACLVSRPQNNLSTIQIIVDDTLAGLAQLGAAGVDLGEMDESPTEEILTETVEEESKSAETSEEEVKKPKEDDKKATEKVEVTTKKSKVAAKKPKVSTKKATASKAKKKDEGKASESAPVVDKKTKSKKSSGDDSA